MTLRSSRPLLLFLFVACVVNVAAAISACGSFGGTDEPSPDNDAANSDVLDAGAEAVDSSTIIDATPACVPQPIEGGGPVDANCEGNGTIDLLTSKVHCGRCNHDCAGEGCADGKCEVIPVWTLTTAGHVSIGALAAGYIYFTYNSQSASYLRRLAIPGTLGDLGESLFSDQSPAGEFFHHAVVSGASLFFVSSKVGIKTAPASGGVVSDVVPGANNLIDGLVVNNDRVFWSNGNQISEALHDGGASQPIQNAPPGVTRYAFGSDGKQPYWVILTNLDGGATDVSLMTRSTDSSRRITTLPAPVPHLAFDETHVYMADGSSGDVWRVLKASGPPELVTHAESTRKYAKGITVDEAFVYFALSTDPSIGSQQTEIWQASKCGGPARYIGEVSMSTAQLVHDDRYLYWGTQQAVHRMAK